MRKFLIRWWLTKDWEAQARNRISAVDRAQWDARIAVLNIAQLENLQGWMKAL